MTPASIRNKNPGAQEPGPSSRKFGSTSHELLKWTYKGKPAINKIATFPTSQHGAAAMFHLLMNGRSKIGKLRYRDKPIKDAIATWCGSYYAAGYAKAIEASGCAKADDILTAELIQKPEFAVALCKAMARVEAGCDYPMSDEEWRSAHEMAFGGAVAPEFSPDNDVPSPGPNARAVATVKEIAKVAVPSSIVVGGGATVATQPKTESPKPVIAPKETVSKARETAKEIRENVEVAKDYYSWAKPTAVAAWENAYVVGPLILVAGLAIFWPRVRERLPW
jgi:hypothetical protein